MEKLTLRPDKKLKTLWRLRLLICFALTIVLCAAVDLFSFALAVIFFAVLTILLISLFVYLPFYYRSIFYIFDGDKIYKQAGIIFKSYTVLPRVQILYSATLSTPFMRMLGFRDLHLYGCGARLCLSALTDSDMERVGEIIA